MKSHYKLLGDYIREVNVRNSELKDLNLLGISIQKEFIPSIANTIGTDMAKYKIVKRNQFAYGTVTSRNGDKISIALLQDYDEALISQAYISFEVIDENKLSPEYLMMWFRRQEFDRYARYMSYGSAREVFSWDEMCNVKLPVPTIEKQREIVKEYNIILNRIKLNENMINKLEDLAQTIYKQWFVDFEYPDNGEVVETPENWEVLNLESIIDFNNGKKVDGGAGEIPIYGGNGILGYTKDSNAENGIAIGRVGAYCGIAYREFGKMWVSDNGIFAKDKEELNNYAFYLISNLNLNERAEGTGQPLVTQNMLKNISISLPPKVLRQEFDRKIGKILTLIDNQKREIKMLYLLREINLSMISK